MEHIEIKETVIYTVQVYRSNKGAWYNGKESKSYDCILEIVDKQFGGVEIMFRVLHTFKPVKYIKLEHGIIKKQRIGSHKNLVSYYGHN